MSPCPDFVSPTQAARAFGVSESSLKRWCDQGLIASVRTAGGHRKMAVADVLAFFRQQNRELNSPGLLGLPPVSEHARLGLARGRLRLADALLAGDDLVARQIVLDLYHARHSLAVICDQVIAAAFHEIGDRWACGNAEVYQERRAVQIAQRVLFELRNLQPAPAGAWLAVGGTIEGDQYSLPSAMADLVLRGAGFQASPLGTSIPWASLINAVQTMRPRIFWLSVSHLHEGRDFPAEFAALSRACDAAGAALVVGGRALTESLRAGMRYAAFGDTMEHLESFASTWRESLVRGRRRLAARPRQPENPPLRRKGGSK